MEDTFHINSNVAYQVCRKDVQQYENISKNKESIPIEMGSKIMQCKATNQHLSMDACNHSSLSELTVDNLKAAQTKIKKVLACVVLLCTVLVVTTLTAIVLSVLSYKPNGEPHTRLTVCTINEDTISVNGTPRVCNQDIQLQLNEHIQKELASLQIQIYCGTGQWHQIAFLNMSDPLQLCPPGWKEYNTGGVRACGRAPSNEGSCSTITHTAENIAYSRVCGQVIGYQIGSPDAFNRQELNHNNIDIDGVNISVQGYHIWSVVAGVTENSSIHTNSNCPCSFTSGQGSPSYISNKYYCESGNPTDNYESNQIFSNNPLWDRQQCEGTCCTGTNYPPWFSVQLPAPTTDVIEVNICGDESTDNEDTPIKLLEIYIQ